MQTQEAVKDEKIAHLEYCLNKLQYKNYSYNEDRIYQLYSHIYGVICKMNELDALSALEYFRENINVDIRNELLHFNIELMV